MNEEQKKTSYFKHYDEFYGIIKPLSEVQLGMLTEALAIYRGFQLNERTLEELLSDPAVQIAFNAYKISIDKGDRAYENKCAANRENGKKGGRPKKKRPEPELEPEEDAEDLTEEAEPVPDPDPEPDREPDREPEPDEPLVIDSFIEWRIAKMFTELYRKPNNFADFHGEQLAELLAYMAISGIFAQWLKQVNELDTLDAVRDLSKREFDADSSGKDYEAEFMSAKEAALNIIQYSMGSTLAAIEEYNERQ